VLHASDLQRRLIWNYSRAFVFWGVLANFQEYGFSPVLEYIGRERLKISPVEILPFWLIDFSIHFSIIEPELPF
jgi:hypothetical protein